MPALEMLDLLGEQHDPLATEWEKTTTVRADAVGYVCMGIVFVTDTVCLNGVPVYSHIVYEEVYINFCGPWGATYTNSIEFTSGLFKGEGANGGALW